MLTGAHVLLYSSNADADREFLRDVLELRSVDSGGGWLIFALPPAEVAVHPAETDSPASPRGTPTGLGTELYLMCSDVAAYVKSLEARDVRCAPITTEPWGLRTSIRLPSGGELGLYQPTHPMAI